MVDLIRSERSKEDGKAVSSWRFEPLVRVSLPESGHQFLWNVFRIALTKPPISLGSLMV